ncbi:hypothetical protein BAE44_0010971, partial [Dichanthelium oligosanthes]
LKLTFEELLAKNQRENDAKKMLIGQVILDHQDYLQNVLLDIGIGKGRSFIQQHHILIFDRQHQCTCY